MKKVISYFQTSIGRKQVVAVTGLGLILFLIAHLAGNLLIFMGPEVFNNYAKKLAGLRPGLYAAEAGLLLIFLVHVYFTAVLVIENVRARPVVYRVRGAKGERSLAAQIMPYTGAIIFAFVIYHLFDFTFTPHHGILPDGKDYGLYGLVYNSFSDWLHSTFYIIAMACVGFHLSHAIESIFQTFGFMHPGNKTFIQKVSLICGVLIGWGFSSIPLYVLIKNLVN